jgi:uncharacterized protein
MSHYAFSFGPSTLHALPSGALFWVERNLLIAADLHLGKSDRLARRGGVLLPPYETRATLTRLGDELDRTGARSVICLGDSFDDDAAGDALDEDDRLTLLRLMAGRDWTWIAGNHDPAPISIGGAGRGELALDGVTFRHIASSTGRLEVSGHFHPKVRLGGSVRPCFLVDERRVILPAFGTYTGGLYCDNPVLVALMSPSAVAVLTGIRAIACPMPRGA